MTTVDQIKHRWQLRSMLARLNITVPSKGKFRSPFRPDNNPSCEIWQETIRDRSTGETYDSIRCFAEAKSLSNVEAIKALAAELPGAKSSRPAPQKRELVIPPLHWNHADAEKLAALRDIGIGGIHLAGAVFGTLGFGEICGFHSWILCDGSRRLAEARRMDGKPYPAVGSIGERKSHTLKGSLKSWPMGIDPPKVSIPPGLPCTIVEGGPDYLSLCDVLFQSKLEFVPIAMLGASASIHADSMTFFKGRDVRILAHPDDAGIKAAQRWAAQLTDARANPVLRQSEGGDLNDLLKIHGAKAIAEILAI